MLNSCPVNRSRFAFTRLLCTISSASRYARDLVARLKAQAHSHVCCSYRVGFLARTTGPQPGYPNIRRRIFGALAGLVIAFPVTSTATSAEIQDLDSIGQAVESFFFAQVPTTRGERSITVTNIDQRLRLRACEESLVAFFPPGSRAGRNRTVGVSCAGPKPWTIYVSVRVRFRGDVLVAARALPRGVVIGSDDALVEERELEDGSFGYLTNPYDALGKRTIRPVRSGMPITEDTLEKVPTVVRGQRVTLVAQSPSLLVRMFGTALEDGSPGDRIQVENSKSKRVVEGIVGEGGVVRIAL